MKSKYLAIVTVLVLLVAGGGGVWWWMTSQSSDDDLPTKDWGPKDENGVPVLWKEIAEESNAQTSRLLNTASSRLNLSFQTDVMTIQTYPKDTTVHISVYYNEKNGHNTYNYTKITAEPDGLKITRMNFAREKISSWQWGPQNMTQEETIIPYDSIMSYTEVLDADDFLKYVWLK